MIKSSALALRIGAIALTAAAVVLLGIVWLNPALAAVHYRSGKRLYWRLETVEIKSRTWEGMLLFLNEEKRASDFVLSPSGYTYSFHDHYADCTFWMVIKPRSQRDAVDPATEAYLKHLVGRFEVVFKRMSVKAELNREEDSYRVDFSLKLTDDDFEQALRDRKLN